jgi:hypothetical protein
MPNDSLFIKKAIALREGMGELFMKKKKKDLADIDRFIKNDAKDPMDKAEAQRHRDSVAKRGYTKEEIDARVKRAKMQSMKAGL